MKTTCWRASQSTNIKSQQINSTLSIQYKTDKLNKAKNYKENKNKTIL